MSVFDGKPHISRRGGRTIIEYRVGDVGAARTAMQERAGVTTIPGGGGGWTPWGGIAEGFAGAWQRNAVANKPRHVLAFSAVYSCVSLIAGDISKLRLMLTEQQGDGTWLEITNPASPLLAVLRKPNSYQTRAQFIDDWITSKLIHGNAYILLERDNRGPGQFDGVVTAMYVLNPRCVTPLVSDAGEVFYRLGPDYLAKVEETGIVVPASEIIHDRMSCFWHPLVGVSPIYACGRSALQGLAIQDNSESFFANMSVPSGVLMVPGKIAPDQAAAMKKDWSEKFSGVDIGKLAILTDGMKYATVTIPATDAQLIEQLKWTVEDVARCFHVPPYKLGLNTNVTFSNAGQLDQDYYSQCIQKQLEAVEQLIDDALGLPADRRSEFDTDGLTRMDPLAAAEADAKAIKASVLAPNEARRKRNLPPVEGGDSPMAQQQDFSLAALAKRDARPDPFATATPPAPPAPALPAPAAPAPTGREIAAEIQLVLAPLFTERKSELVVTMPQEPVDRLAAMMNERFAAVEGKVDSLINPEEDPAEEFANLLIRRFEAASVA